MHWRRNKSLPSSGIKPCFSGGPDRSPLSYSKVKLSPCLLEHHTVKTYGGQRHNWSILNLRTRWETRPELFALRNNRYLRDQRLRAPRSRSGRGDDHCLCQEVNPCSPAVASLHAYCATALRLLVSGWKTYTNITFVESWMTLAGLTKLGLRTLSYHEH
jgi:hypothetical protein